jgi:hypothetical protein
MRIHTGEKPYICSEGCGKKFSQVIFKLIIKYSNYIRHLRIHKGIKPFTCEICHRSFSSTSNLKQHSTIHSTTVGRERLKCIIENCPKSYLYMCTLKKHLIDTHKDEYEQIKLEFISSSNLTNIYHKIKNQKNVSKEGVNGKPVLKVSEENNVTLI